MSKLLGRVLEAGSVLQLYLKRCHAQAQTLMSCDMQCASALAVRDAVQNDPPLSRPLLSDLQMLASASTNGQGMHDENVTAALDLHSRIVCNLTARLTLSARILFGNVLTEPWEIVTAFEQ